MSQVSLLLVSLLGVTLISNMVNMVNGQSYFCDNDYNVSSCRNTTLTGYVFKCRGFMSCKDSMVETSKDLYCQGDRACKNLVYDNADDNAMYGYGYRSADSLYMNDEASDGYCFGYQSCLDIVYNQTDNGNHAFAYGYESMYNAYIDYSETIYVNGYKSLYSATINTTDVKDDTLEMTIYGYSGSVETDILCQDGITCNINAFGYNATTNTYLYCLAGSYCNVYCGTSTGCSGMNIYAYSTSTVYFDCDDASACPNLDDAEATAKLMAYSKSAIEIDSTFDTIMNNRLNEKYTNQYAFKQDRMREEKSDLAVIKHNNNEMKTTQAMQAMQAWQYSLIQSIIILIVGIVIGIVTMYSYNKCVTNKDYSYQSIV